MITVVIFLLLLFIGLYFYSILQYKEIFIPSVPSPSSIDNFRIVVSLTTSPRRINSIKPVIDCILNQTLKPVKIYLNLPKIFKRNNSKFGKIPDFITNNSLIHINYCEDIGPLTKILPTAILLKNSRDVDLIVSVDDDIIYDKNTLQKFAQESINNPNIVLTGSSWTCNNLNECQIVEGWSGVGYKPEFLFDFDTSVLNDIECYLSDDFLISNHLSKKGIKIKRINTVKQPQNYGEEEDALHKGIVTDNWVNGKNYRYQDCSKLLSNNSKLYLKYY